MFPMHFWIREFVTGKEQHKRWQKKYLDFLINRNSLSRMLWRKRLGIDS